MKSISIADHMFYDFTGLGRPIELRYASNRLAVVGSVAVAAAVGLVRWFGRGEIDLFASAAAGISGFLAWAIARELDPDRPDAATAALIIAGGLSMSGGASLGIVAVALVAIRILVGSVGAVLRPADIAVILVAAGYAGTRPATWPAAAGLAIALAVARPPRLSWLSPAVVVVAGAAAVALAGAPSPDSPTSSSLLLMSLVALAVLIPVTAVDSTTDVGRRAISPTRVTAARVVAASLFVAGGLLHGDAAPLGPVAAAVIAVARLRRRGALAAAAGGSAEPSPTPR